MALLNLLFVVFALSGVAGVMVVLSKLARHGVKDYLLQMKTKGIQNRSRKKFRHRLIGFSRENDDKYKHELTGEMIEGVHNGKPFKVFFENDSYMNGFAGKIVLEIMLEGNGAREMFVRSFVSETNRLLTNDNAKASLMQTHDDEFDRTAGVSAMSGAHAFALLSPVLMEKISALCRNTPMRSFRLKNRVLRIEFSYSPAGTVNDIERILEYGFSVADNMKLDDDIETLIRKNFDSVAAAERKFVYLDALAGIKPDWQEDDPMIKAALSSGEWVLKLSAIKALGPKGFAHAEELLNKGPGTARSELVHYLTMKRIEQLAPAVLTRFDKADRDEKKELLVYFSKLNYTGAQNRIMDELAAIKDDADDYFYDCLNALEECGTRKAIEFLYILGRQVDDDPAIQQAISRIQSRIGTGQEGWLSIESAEEGEGELSVVGDEE